MSKICKTHLENIKQQIIETTKDIENPIAAFDADGTLWPIDMGETFFNYQINNKLVPLPDKAWEHYTKLHAEKPREAYLWLAQINKGQNISTVRKWAKAACDEKNFEIFSEQKQIVDTLHQCGVQVYIVTASIKWAVEPAAAKFNIPFDNVIGIVTQIENDIVTDKQGGPITYREGKVSALREKVNGSSHFFGSGNTMGDISLLEDATHMRISVTSANTDHSNHSSEQKLHKISTENNWLQFDYL